MSHKLATTRFLLHDYAFKANLIRMGVRVNRFEAFVEITLRMVYWHWLVWNIDACLLLVNHFADVS